MVGKNPLLLLTALVLLATSSPVIGDVPPAIAGTRHVAVWAPNGPVNAVAVDGNRVRRLAREPATYRYRSAREPSIWPQELPTTTASLPSTALARR